MGCLIPHLTHPNQIMKTKEYIMSLQSCPVLEGYVGPADAAGVPEPVDVPCHTEQDPRLAQGHAAADPQL